jgi:hypothetical protein
VRPQGTDDEADLRPGATLVADPTDGGRGIGATLTVEGRAGNRCRIVSRYRQRRGTMNVSANAGGSTFAQVEVVTGGGRLDGDIPLAEQRAIVAQVEATLGRIAAAAAEARAAVDVAAR